MATKTKWKDIPGYEGFYQVSADGRIKNVSTGRELKNRKMVRLKGNGSEETTTIARVVLTTFKGRPPSEKHYAVHLDRDKTNNALKNLAWKTRSEFPPKSKLNEKQVKEMRKLAKKGTAKSELAEQFGVSQNTVTAIINQRIWTTA